MPANTLGGVEPLVAEELERVAVKTGWCPTSSPRSPTRRSACRSARDRPLVATRNSCSASGNGSGRPPAFCRSLCIAPSSRYATPNETPPATEMFTPPWKLRLFGRPVSTAAPASTIRSVTWRPCSGSSTIRSCSTTSLMPALRTSTIGAAASTETVSSRLPTPSTALMVGVAPTCSTMPVWT